MKFCLCTQSAAYFSLSLSLSLSLYIYIYIYIYRFWIGHHKTYFWSLPLRVLVPFNAKKPQDKHRFWVQRHKPSFWSLLSGVLVPFQCQKRQGVKQIFLVKHRKSLFWWLPLRVLAPEPEVEIWEGDKYPPPESELRFSIEGRHPNFRKFSVTAPSAPQKFPFLGLFREYWGGQSRFPRNPIGGGWSSPPPWAPTLPPPIPSQGKIWVSPHRQNMW